MTTNLPRFRAIGMATRSHCYLITTCWTMKKPILQLGIATMTFPGAICVHRLPRSEHLNHRNSTKDAEKLCRKSKAKSAKRHSSCPPPSSQSLAMIRLTTDFATTTSGLTSLRWSPTHQTLPSAKRFSSRLKGKAAFTFLYCFPMMAIIVYCIMKTKPLNPILHHRSCRRGFHQSPFPSAALHSIFGWLTISLIVANKILTTLRCSNSIRECEMRADNKSVHTETPEASCLGWSVYFHDIFRHVSNVFQGGFQQLFHRVLRSVLDRFIEW